MDNTIFKNQNTKQLLKCLAAQRHEYSIAKKANMGKDIATIIFGVYSMLTSVIDSDLLSALSCLFAITILIVNRHIDIYTLKHQKNAALIQQYFDATLFSSIVDVDTIKWGPLPTQTELAESTSTVVDSMLEPFKNWYNDYSTLSPAWQVFCCQKENIRWDARLRSEFKYLVISALSITLIALVITALTINPSIIKFINIFAWFLPIADYGFNTINKLRDDIARLDLLKKQAEDVEIQLANNNTYQIYDKLISLQQKIMDHRQSSILVPDWFYQIRKNKHQKREANIADTLKI